MIDTAFADGRGITAIGEALAQGPNIKVIALTPDPAPHEDVAFAIRAGASGIVDVDTDPVGFAAAVRATHRGEIWLPPAEVRDVLGSVAEDLDITSSERRTRLTGLALGLIPLMGAMATVMSLLWRRHLGHIGVRPVDLAIDPATRVVDAIAAVSMLIGVVGPLLFIGSWIDLGADHGFWHVRRRRLTHLVMSLAWLVAAWFLALFADLVLMIFVDPLVTVAVLARILDLDDELPSVLRMSRMNPRRAFVGGLFATVVFLTALSTEAMVTGPDFQAEASTGSWRRECSASRPNRCWPSPSTVTERRGRCSTSVGTRTSMCSSIRATTTRWSTYRSARPGWWSSTR
jgi:hypothetical protein